MESALRVGSDSLPDFSSRGWLLDGFDSETTLHQQQSSTISILASIHEIPHECVNTSCKKRFLLYFEVAPNLSIFRSFREPCQQKLTMESYFTIIFWTSEKRCSMKRSQRQWYGDIRNKKQLKRSLTSEDGVLLKSMYRDWINTTHC